MVSVDGAVETWSRQILRPEDLPEDGAVPIRELFPVFPYCVRSPAMRSFRISEPESFLCLGEPRVAVLKRGRSGVKVFQAELASIAMLEMETTLLHSCLTLHSKDGQTVAVPYNTVMESLFAPVVAAYLKARAVAVPEAAQLRSLCPDPFGDLMTRDYKYHSYAFQVLPGDEVKARLYHPSACVPSLFHWLRLIPSYLLVASGSMLYVLSEKEPFRPRNRADYSLLVRYVPLSQGVSASFRSVLGEHRYRMVTFQAGATSFEMPLARELEAEFAAFADAVPLRIG